MAYHWKNYMALMSLHHFQKKKKNKKMGKPCKDSTCYFVSN